jgi:hypothetical protein
VSEEQAVIEDDIQTQDAEPVEDQEVETPETDEPEAEPAAEKDPPWYKKRIDELTRDKHEARRQAERLEKILEQQEQMLRQMKPPEPEKPGLVAPDPAKYVGGVYDPKYMQDMLQYTRVSAAEEAKQSIMRDMEERQAQKAMAEADAKLQVAEKAARAKWQDYDTVISPITSDPQLAQNQTIRQAVLGMENGPEIAYLLGRNLDVAYEIASMNPVRAGMRLAELLNRAPRKTSNAPTPITPIAGSGGTARNPKDYSQMNTSEFIAARNAEELAMRQARIKR